MELFFTRLGMLVISTGAICAIVYLCVANDKFARVIEIICMLVLMLAGAGLGLYSALAVERITPLIVGIVISAPTCLLCWPYLREKIYA